MWKRVQFYRDDDDAFVSYSTKVKLRVEREGGGGERGREREEKWRQEKTMHFAAQQVDGRERKMI